MNAHTPKELAYQPSAGNHDFLVYDPTDPTGKTLALTYGEDSEPLARLIEQAPAMLKALRELVDIFKDRMDPEHIKQIRAILAAVDGKS